KQLKWRSLPAGAERKARPEKVNQPKPLKTKTEKAPAASHPWRRDGVGAGRRFWSGIKAEGRLTREASRLGCGTRSASASLGLPPSRTPAGQSGPRTTNNEGDIL